MSVEVSAIAVESKPGGIVDGAEAVLTEEECRASEGGVESAGVPLEQCGKGGVRRGDGRDPTASAKGHTVRGIEVAQG